MSYDEKKVIAGCRENSRRHQEALYKRYFPTMMGMCMRYTHNQEDAMEIINMGFLKVFQKIDTYKFQGSFEGWIRRIVFHTLSDHFRRKPKGAKVVFFDGYDKAHPSEALENLYFEDVIRYMDCLPKMSKLVFSLYVIEGYNHKEIGEHLQISEGTSKWHLSNARKKLKELLKQQNLTQNYANGT